jgi:hypothetical protein
MSAQVRSTTPFALAPLALVLLLPALVTGQEAPVYATDSKNGRVLRLDFSAATSTVVSTQKLKAPGGLVVRDDGPGDNHLIVTDTEANRVVFYAGAQGAGETIAGDIRKADGPSLDASGNLYLVSRGSRSYPGKVWRIPKDCGGCVGGYGAPFVIEVLYGSELVETRVASFTEGDITAGDLLVLAEDCPKAVLRYAGAAGASVELVAASAFPKGADPTGMALTPGHEILVVTEKGSILRFNASGERLLPDFAKLQGKGPFRIDAGVQDGVARVFVASRSGGKVLRYKILPNGTGEPDGVVSQGLASPNGVALSPAPAFNTPAGLNVTVSPVPEVELTFEEVTQAGNTGATIIDFTDNRPYPCVTQNLKDFFPVGSPLRTTLPDVAVPCYIRGLPSLLPGDSPAQPTGPETFMLAIVDTSAEFLRTTESHWEEALHLGGYQPPCPSIELKNEPHTFYAPELPKGEPPTVESIEGDHCADDCPFPPVVIGGESVCPIFSDISTGCGSNRGHSWNFSLYLTARDLRKRSDIVEEKLDMMKAALVRYYGQGWVPDPPFQELKGLIREADEEAEDGHPSAASLALGRFITTVRAATIDNSVHNVTGELVARALSAKFFICKKAADAAACVALE